MKKLYRLLFIAGIVLIISPFAIEKYSDWRQEHLLGQLEESLSQSWSMKQEQQLHIEYEQLSKLFEQETVNLQEEPELADRPEEIEASVDSATEPIHSDSQSIAIIEIDKIKLKLPVLEGATQENMKFAAAHMKETTAIGEIGNAAIAAHRARKNGRLFNRLDELKAGDQIRVRTGNEEFVYTVFKTSLVEPTDISVLGTNDEDAVLTLITCDPVVDPTHRLIVHAKL